MKTASTLLAEIMAAETLIQKGYKYVACPSCDGSGFYTSEEFGMSSKNSCVECSGDCKIWTGPLIESGEVSIY